MPCPRWGPHHTKTAVYRQLAILPYRGVAAGRTERVAPSGARRRRHTVTVSGGAVVRAFTTEVSTEINNVTLYIALASVGLSLLESLLESLLVHYGIALVTRS